MGLIPLHNKHMYIIEYPTDIKDENKSVGVYIDSITSIDLIFQCPYALKNLSLSNAGGKSEISESLSLTHLMSEFQAINFIPEMNVKYWVDYKMVDYILQIPQGWPKEYINLGVSVVRAFIPNDRNFTYEDGIRLLTKKISGLIISRNTVIECQSFYHSILHIIVPTTEILDVLVHILTSKMLNLQGLEVVGVLDLWITLCPDKRIYTNKL